MSSVSGETLVDRPSRCASCNLWQANLGRAKPNITPSSNGRCAEDKHPRRTLSTQFSQGIASLSSVSNALLLSTVYN